MSMPRTQYGAVTSAEDARVLADSDLPIMDMQQGAPAVAGASAHRLWSYHNEGTIDGVPVIEAHRHLKIDSERLLDEAFVVSRVPSSIVLLITDGDCAGLDKYNALLSRAYDGTAVIISEDRQYDASKGGYVVWVRYDSLSCMLHPRFMYLLED